MAMSREDYTRLAVMQAVHKAIGEELDSHGKKHGAGNIRTKADDTMRELYETTGVSQLALIVNDAKVGTISARLTKPTSKDWFSCDDPVALADWLKSEDGEAALSRLVMSLGGDIAADSVAQEGELPPGCSPHHEERPGGAWGGTTLRVDVAKVRDALGESLPAAVAGVLMGEVAADA